MHRRDSLPNLQYMSSSIYLISASNILWIWTHTLCWQVSVWGYSTNQLRMLVSLVSSVLKALSPREHCYTFSYLCNLYVICHLFVTLCLLVKNSLHFSAESWSFLKLIIHWISWRSETRPKATNSSRPFRPSSRLMLLPN